MGAFEKVDDRPAQTGTRAEDASEVEAIKKDLELKTNEIKALEEHAAFNKEMHAKNEEKWFNKINIRGYTQFRYNQPFSGDSGHGDPELRSVGDGSIKDNSNFSLRRVRLVFSGDINDYLYIYIQPDFASNVSDSQQHFAQLRDAYADISFDKKHEYRIRPGQSKVPYGWENLQSSQNRIALDRDDALNSAVPSERDLGIFAYWTPEHVQKRWKDLSKKGLKTSGDYGIVGAGIYNGQGLNRAEANDDLYGVGHTTYPIELNFLGYPFTGQVLEIGADVMGGYFNPTVSNLTLFQKDSRGRNIQVSATDLNNSLAANGGKMKEERVAVHAILFPQPFGLQAEWNWGKGPTLNVEGLQYTTGTGANRTTFIRGEIKRENIGGGYVQAMYKIDNVFRPDGVMFPYVKWQTFRGAWKGAANNPNTMVDEVEAGVEYQIMKALEITLAYSHMDRTNVSNLGQASGDLGRVQLQWNY
jgi:uncharacterized protein YbdZ (MbtH family)